MGERKNQILWALCVTGLFLSIAVMVSKIKNVTFKIPEVASHSPNPQYAVPKPIPRKTGTLLSRPFLFQLAGSDKMTGLEREDRLIDRYDDILKGLDGGSPPPVDVDVSLGVATVMVGGKPFATVLPQDCPEYLARLPDDQKLKLEEEVAKRWANVIELDLQVQALKRHPTYLGLFNYLALVFFFLGAVCHLAVSWVSRRFARSPLWSLKALIWVVYLTVISDLHPSLDGLSNLLRRGALSPLFFFLFCGVSATLMHQLTVLALSRYFRVLAQYDADGFKDRVLQRRKTLEQACIFLSQVLWFFLGVCAYLYLLGVELSSFFAGAGLVSIGIGVMARDVFLDFFNGFNIIAEDQFGVGDWIESNTDSGEVVAFSLRATKIRRVDGSLATLPNSDLRRVKNHSNEWSMVDFQVSVTYRTDTDLALDLILDEIANLDDEWQSKILGPPQPLGVNQLAPDGVVLRVLIKTAPMAQWGFNRCLNRRVKIRFDKEGIEFAAPRRTLHMLPVQEQFVT